MTTEHVTTSKDGGRLSVVLDRPAKAHALTQDMLSRLRDVFQAAAEDPELHAMTLSGTGSRVFCAGADLSELSKDPDGPETAIWEEMSEALAAVPVLTAALINGACIGGGMTLALGCDIRLSVPDAVFGYPVLANGVLPARRDFDRLNALAGPGRAALFLLGGARIEAAEAEAWGLVDRRVQAQGLAAAADEVCATALAADRAHLLTLKRLCRGGTSS